MGIVSSQAYPTIIIKTYPKLILAQPPEISAFGGMIAFCIIIGDSIPHVMAAMFPGIEDIPVLSLLTNRRAVIVFATVGISYPLSLYRDIAKVSFRRREVVMRR